MTFAERYRAERSLKSIGSFEEWLGMVETIDPNADVERNDLGVFIRFSDGSLQRVATFKEVKR